MGIGAGGLVIKAAGPAAMPPQVAAKATTRPRLPAPRPQVGSIRPIHLVRQRLGGKYGGQG